MSEVEVLAIGTHVIIDGDIPATVRGIWIRAANYIQYDCVWWDERSRKSDWLTIDEIQVKDNITAAVKFR